MPCPTPPATALASWASCECQHLLIWAACGMEYEHISTITYISTMTHSRPARA